MPDEKKRELTADEIAEQTGEELPDRDEMSLVNANLAVPINIGAALNVLSDGSTATGDATQQMPIDQSTT